VLFLLVFLWFTFADIVDNLGDDMHYDKEYEEYLARLRREKEERKKKDKDRPE
tara:strand:+ start:517 stop:675 length:159 start_codon:yes stop_codon:yes gene_type:complete